MKNYSTIQYSLIFVVVVIFVIAVWGIWCEAILKIVNVIVHGLGYSIVSSQMCNSSLDLFHRVQHIQIPQKIEFDALSDLFAQVAPNIGMILLFLFLLFLIYLLLIKVEVLLKKFGRL